MQVYPKIPHYDHPIVPDDFFDANDLVIVKRCVAELRRIQTNAMRNDADSATIWQHLPSDDRVST
ncbi:hypothetical protein [Haloferax sp. Atlit-48N]|uniref:Uncharacterized protein n=1 Tax=Haloferax sp. Atlit-48N TaxID=2077198 RepID=A0ACD5I089_9EURY|nr:hypothetical protein [Haloferax sp. Atlit-48N]RDZ30420.1 hypothetical protein DEQ67_15405 [Haloferax sp. Atlit-48N]